MFSKPVTLYHFEKSGSALLVDPKLDQPAASLLIFKLNLSHTYVKRTKTCSGWKPTHLTSVFSLRTSVFSLPHGTTLTAFADVKYGCLQMLDGLVSTHPFVSDDLKKLYNNVTKPPDPTSWRPRCWERRKRWRRCGKECWAPLKKDEILSNVWQKVTINSDQGPML